MDRCDIHAEADLDWFASAGARVHLLIRRRFSADHRGVAEQSLSHYLSPSAIGWSVRSFTRDASRQMTSSLRFRRGNGSLFPSLSRESVQVQETSYERVCGRSNFLQANGLPDRIRRQLRASEAAFCE